VVTCVNEEGQDIARGLTNYNAEEARRIAGHASQKIETLLGYGGDAEIIHRDNLVLL
jgi:glutamate 5-kinase